MMCIENSLGNNTSVATNSVMSSMSVMHMQLYYWIFPVIAKTFQFKL